MTFFYKSNAKPDPAFLELFSKVRETMRKRDNKMGDIYRETSAFFLQITCNDTWYNRAFQIQKLLIIILKLLRYFLNNLDFSGQNQLYPLKRSFNQVFYLGFVQRYGDWVGTVRGWLRNRPRRLQQPARVSGQRYFLQEHSQLQNRMELYKVLRSLNICADVSIEVLCPSICPCVRQYWTACLTIWLSMDIFSHEHWI